LLDDAGFVDATAVRMLLGVVYLYAATRASEAEARLEARDGGRGL
jgi:hypothetical protein